LRYYRKRGYYVVAGGSYASLCPERYQGVADTVVAGEAEYIWRDFCRDFEQNAMRRLYRETGVVDLADSPTPRFDLLKLNWYRVVSLQFSRGCPYRCEFCDIIVMFGRRPRTKSPEQVGRELDQVRALGVHNVFFVDDNLIGNRPRAKELLRYLAHYQRQYGYGFQFGTEASLNLAEDDELLDLFRAANFGWIFIGIESPDKASLKETGKIQNTRTDILGAVHKIYRNGIDVLAGFIVGFDNDTLDTFDRQKCFIKASGIQVAMVGLLTALPRTPLYQRLQQEGRLLVESEHADNTSVGTNFLPKRMDYGAMVQAYANLYRQLVSDRSIADRIRNKTRHLRQPVSRDVHSLPQRLAMVVRLIARGLLPGGPVRWYHFLRTLARCVPRAWPLAISDWVAGLAMRDFVERQFNPDVSSAQRMTKAAHTFIGKQAARLRQGAAAVSLVAVSKRTHLTVTLRGAVDKRFLTRAGQRLESLLRRSTATLTLRIDELAESQRQYLDKLLRRLSRYGDRIWIQIDERNRRRLSIDLSVFQLALDQT
ncbi:MAG: radical SAM protein, partial [Acidiferrobacterales bacterium]